MTRWSQVFREGRWHWDAPICSFCVAHSYREGTAARGGLRTPALGYDFIPPPARRGYCDCGRSDGLLEGKMDETADGEKPP